MHQTNILTININNSNQQYTKNLKIKNQSMNSSSQQQANNQNIDLVLENEIEQPHIEETFAIDSSQIKAKEQSSFEQMPLTPQKETRIKLLQSFQESYLDGKRSNHSYQSKSKSKIGATSKYSYLRANKEKQQIQQKNRDLSESISYKEDQYNNKQQIRSSLSQKHDQSRKIRNQEFQKRQEAIYKHLTEPYQQLDIQLKTKKEKTRDQQFYNPIKTVVLQKFPGSQIVYNHNPETQKGQWQLVREIQVMRDLIAQEQFLLNLETQVHKQLMKILSQKENGRKIMDKENIDIQKNYKIYDQTDDFLDKAENYVQQMIKLQNKMKK